MHRPDNMRVAWWLAVAPLLHHVIHVVLVCAEEQMAWIAARWHIALMANKHSAWDFAVEVLVCDAMRPVVWHASAARANDSISKLIGRARKNPASRKWNANNLIKNSFNNRFHLFLQLPAHMPAGLGNDHSAFLS